jgi:hypothetical protein
MGFRFIGMAEGMRRMFWFALPALLIVIAAALLSWVGASSEGDAERIEMERPGAAMAPGAFDPRPEFEGTADESSFRGAYCPDEVTGRPGSWLRRRCSGRAEVNAPRRASR